MSIGEICRSQGYWVLDAVMGGRVRRHLEDIERLFPYPELTSRASAERLEELLRHACSHTAYYREFQGCSRLADFPVMKKETIKKNMDGFLSDAFAVEKLSTQTTSGSYGVPMKFWLSPEKRARQLAEVIYFGRWAGYDVGTRHAYIRSQPSVAGKSALKLFLQNEVLMDSTVLSRQWLEAQRVRLRRKDLHFLIGYASAIIELAEYVSSCGDTPDMFGVKGVMVLAEPFSGVMREKVARAFGCPVIAKYSSQETGVIACECPQNHEYHLNRTSFVVELLELDSDRPVKPGQLGRVVVTDLYSHAMPLIRYDMGDLAVEGTAAPACGLDTSLLDRVEGRIAAAVYNTRGNMVHFASIVNRIWDMRHVLMYQFIQEEGRKYTVKIVPLPGYDESQEPLYLQRMREVLGEDACIAFQKVDDIPPLNSGKRPFYINLHSQKKKREDAV